MIDKAAFIGSNGAKESLRRLGIIINNLANVNTTGFRGDLDVVKSIQVPNQNQKMESRTFASFDSTFTNFKYGTAINTGRDLDISISGPGFIAVQNKEGNEAYTRAGDLDINSDGYLTTKTGEMVLGNAGPIYIPPYQKVSISQDGSISALIAGNPDMITLNRIKLTNPATSNMAKGVDGLFYPKDGQVPLADNKVQLTSRSLEGSNVSAVEALTQIVDLSRNYEVHTKMLKSVGDDASAANKILDLPR